MEKVIDLSPQSLIAVWGMIFVVLGISMWQRLGITKNLIIGALRCFLQLILIGYIIGYIFNLNIWWAVVIFVIVMLIIATITGGKRPEKVGAKGVYRIVGLSLTVGSVLTIFYVLEVVIRVKNWWEPQYMIPLAGMIIGNSMNGAALAVERLASEIDTNRKKIELSLALGSTSFQATKPYINKSIRASLIPSINTMMVAGIVHLPGMMTGQILAGSSPIVAGKYQIMVMFMLPTSVTITSLLVAFQYYKKHFTRAFQLKEKYVD